MSWFSSQSSVPYEELIKEATDESIPNGELNVVKALELIDAIKSKRAPAKEVMRSLKKRLLSTKNPNLQLSTLELIDYCIKNGGSHFITEIGTREFLDSFNTKILQDDSTYPSVEEKALKLIQTWAKSLESKNFVNLYETLQKQGFSFPIYEGTESKTMFESSVPPEWEDSDACMLCSEPFSLMNRKHHCRNCGGVFCGEHSTNYLPLPDLGITDNVRVCDTCYSEVKSKKKSHKSKKKRDVINARLNYDSDEDDEDLKRALELSLKDSQRNGQVIEPEPTPIVTNNQDEEDDEDLKAAIAASLKDMESSKQPNNYSEPPAQTSQPGIYDNLLPQSGFQYQPQEQPPTIPSYAPVNNHNQENYYTHRLTSTEENAIRTFTIKTMEAKYNPNEVDNLTQHYKNAIPFQPKLNNELNDSISKYDQFVDLNYKIDQAMRLYNKILDDKIEREAYGYQHPQQQYAAPLQQQYTAPQSSQPPPQQYNTSAPQQYSPSVSSSVPQPASYQNYQPSEPLQQANYPQYAPSSPQQYHSTPVSVQPQYSGTESVSANPPVGNTEQDLYNAPPAPEDEETYESGYSAPLPEPEAHQQSPNQTQRPAFEIPAPPPCQMPAQRITDFNFPNVPASRLNNPSQPVAQEQIQEPEPPKEELLIEL